jgi:hypothetical protein
MVYKRDYIYTQVGGVLNTDTETRKSPIDMAQRMMQIMNANTGEQKDLEELEDLLDDMDEMDAQSMRPVFSEIIMRAIQYLNDHGVEIDEG